MFEFFTQEEELVKESETPTLTQCAFIRQANIHLNCLTDTQQIEYYLKVSKCFFFKFQSALSYFV